MYCTGINSMDDCDMFKKAGPGTGSSAIAMMPMDLINWIELAWLLHHMITCNMLDLWVFRLWFWFECAIINAKPTKI